MMRILGPISTAQCLHKTYDFAPLFETDLHERQVNQMRQQRVRGYEKMSPWYENAKCALREIIEELTQCPYLLFPEHGKSR